MPGSTTVPLQQEDKLGDGRWKSLHDCFVNEAKDKEPEVLLIGDYHIQYLIHSKIWKQMFEELHSLNFGIDDDRTEHILWRIQNGELDQVSPKVIVLQAGHNNYDCSHQEVTNGVVAIHSAIREKQPNSYIIVLGLLPRGQKPNPLREKYEAVNNQLGAELKNLPLTLFLNYEDHVFMNHNQVIDRKVMSDFIHLTSVEGYQRLCEPLLEEVQNILGTFVKVQSTSFDASDCVVTHSSGDEL